MKYSLDNFRNTSFRIALLAILGTASVSCDNLFPKNKDTAQKIGLVLSPEEKKNALNDTIQQTENCFTDIGLQFTKKDLESGNGVEFDLGSYKYAENIKMVLRCKIFQLHEDWNDASGTIYFDISYGPEENERRNLSTSFKEFKSSLGGILSSHGPFSLPKKKSTNTNSLPDFI